MWLGEQHGACSDSQFQLQCDAYASRDNRHAQLRGRQQQKTEAKCEKETRRGSQLQAANNCSTVRIAIKQSSASRRSQTMRRPKWVKRRLAPCGSSAAAVWQGKKDSKRISANASDVRLPCVYAKFAYQRTSIAAHEKGAKAQVVEAAEESTVGQKWKWQREQRLCHMWKQPVQRTACHI